MQPFGQSRIENLQVHKPWAMLKSQGKDKEMAPNVSSVYTHVVEDVINNVRAEFQSEGVDEGVLNELKSLWELKMMQAGAIIQGAEISLAKGGTVPITPVHDLNVPYEATEEYETPTEEMLFPPTPLTNTLEPVMYHYLPPGPSESAAMPETGIAGDAKVARPLSYMQQPAPWMGQKNLGVDVNIAYEEERVEEETGTDQPPVTKDFFTLSTGKRKREDFASNFLSRNYIPQQDGAGDGELISVLGEPTVTSIQERICADSLIASSVASMHWSTSYQIPQLDGIDDNYDDGVAEEDYNQAGEEESQSANMMELKTPKAEGADSDGSEPPLNEDDDENLDDLDQGDEDPKTDHLVVAQFEKVTRSKNKWKCILKDGAMHLNKRDYLFAKANGEFEF